MFDSIHSRYTNRKTILMSNHMGTVHAAKSSLRVIVIFTIILINCTVISHVPGTMVVVSIVTVVAVLLLGWALSNTCWYLLRILIKKHFRGSQGSCFLCSRHGWNKIELIGLVKMQKRLFYLKIEMIFRNISFNILKHTKSSANHMLRKQRNMQLWFIWNGLSFKISVVSI